MKIAFIDFVLEPDKPGASGLSDIVWDTARELAQLGDEPHIVGPYAVEPAQVEGVTVHRFALPPIGYRNIAGHILIALRAWLVVRRIPDLDVIYAPEYLSTGLIAPFSRTPVVLRTPGNIYERRATSNPFDWTTTQVLKLAARSSARSCTLVIAISNDMARWWRRTGVPGRRGAVISNGVDITAFRPAADGGVKAAGEPLRLLYVGRLSREKNVAVLLEALARLRDKATLELIGDGPLRQQLEAHTAALGLAEQVTFHGQLPKGALPRHYAAADVLVVPSLSEPLGRVVLEGLASGTAVVGARVGGIPDHVDDGVTGFLFDPYDAAELADRLARLADDSQLVTGMQRNARAYAEQQLAWPHIVARIRGVLAEHLALVPARAAQTASQASRSGPDFVTLWRTTVNALPQGKPRAAALKLANVQFKGKDQLLKRMQPSDQTVRHRFEDGVEMVLDLRDPSQNAMYYGLFEPLERRLLALLAQPGDTVLDIGAHIGFHTLTLARQVGSGGAVHAFEPLRLNFASLERNLRANGFEHVHANHAAVSERAGVVDLHVPARRIDALGQPVVGVWHSSLSSIVGAALDADVLVEQVRALAIDDYLAERGIMRVQLVKLDIEGAELLALRGMQRTLHGPQAPRIVCEVSAARLERCGFGARAVHEEFERAGYTSYLVTEHGLTRAGGPASATAFSANFLFLPPHDALLDGAPATIPYAALERYAVLA